MFKHYFYTENTETTAKFGGRANENPVHCREFKTPKSRRRRRRIAYKYLI